MDAVLVEGRHVPLYGAVASHDPHRFRALADSHAASVLFSDQLFSIDARARCSASHAVPQLNVAALAATTRSGS